MRKQLLLVTGLLSITILCGTVLTSIRTVAETTKRDNFSLTIPTSCTMSGVGTSSHTASMSTDSYSAASGSPYENGIGKTTITTFCNDENGFSIYAVGYTGATEGNNTLVGVNTSTNIINTGVHASTDTTSNWAMKITKVTDSSESYLPQNMSIQDNFDSWHTVPDTFAKVVQYHATTGSSVTDDLLGAKVETTYAAYIASDQTPDTYTGQVKYVLVHPYNGVSPDTDEYTTTVTLGTNITKITFTSDITEPQTIKSSGDTVSLYDGVTYTITATTAEGYELASWTTDQHGTIGNTTQNPTTFTATGTTTLSATAQEQLPEHTCTKEYRLQNADGTYPASYTADGTETLRQGSTCTYTKSVENYQTQEDTATMTTDQTISLDLPRNTYELTVNKDNTNITTVTGAGTYRWGETVNISATPATGSRFTTWSQTSGTTGTFADNTSATTTFTMPTSAATITATGEPIPSYNVTVTLDTNTTSVSFTNATYGTQNITTSGSAASLHSGVEYTITATTTSGYEFSSWTPGTNATLGSTTTNPTTLTVTGTSTLSATSREEGTGPQPSTAGCINYFANASTAVGTMGCQSATDNASVTLLASNFSRTGYGFAGWSDKFDYATNPNAKFYGPQETITVPTGTTANGLSLYAVWIKSQGSIQDQSKVASVCNSLTTAATDGTANLTSVSALTDQRDNNTYAIAKLADGKCWMIENLRLESTAEHNSDGTLAQGYGTSATYGNFSGLANAESENFYNYTTANSIYYSGTQSGTASINIGTTNYPGYRMPRYNNINTSTRATNPTNNSGNMYSYGNYYTWHAAIADLTYNGTNNQSTTGTSLCPTGWRLPQGGNKTRIESNDDNDFWNLAVDALNGGTNPANYDSDTYPYYTGTAEAGPVADKLRSYPNNFLYSGYFSMSSTLSRGSYGIYWSSTAVNSYNSYTLYLYSSSVYPGTGYEYKNRGQSIRCTAGSSTPAPTTETLTVSLDSNVTSVTFSDGMSPDQTVTTNGGTVNLTPNTSYTITAATTTGYEFSSWTAGTGATLGSTTANPTTLTVTGATTLSVTSQQIPSYNVTVTLDTNITSVGFYNATYGTQNITTSGDTASLRSGVEYTITATTASGYVFSSWTAGANATLGSTTANPTALTVTSATTLSATSREEGIGPQSSTAGCINYFANASTAVGTMGCQSADDNGYVLSDGAFVTLHASNFSRTGYGFAGWSDSYDYATNQNAHFYGPQETITVPTGTTANGLSLYAVWIESQGSIQDQSKVASVCNSLTTAPTDGTANLTSVSALTDQRDNNTYAIAKLADGNCWMIENLRLDNTAEHNSDGALAQGYGTSTTFGNFSGLANVESANFSNSTAANSIYYSGTQSGTASINIGTSNYPGYRMPRYNNLNTSTRASNPTNDGGNMYSYGNYYTWHAAIADLTYNGTNNQSTTGTSLCPTGWHLPKGGDKSNEANNELWSLVVDGINGRTKPANYDSETYPYYTGTPEASNVSNKLRAYPNNFLYSGSFSGSPASGRGLGGHYWSSTARNNSNSYDLRLNSSDVYPGTNIYGKNFGYSIRCTVASSTPTPTTETLTVSLDSNVTSVTFSDGTSPDQTVTTNGGTVNLTPNTSYTITATFASGYKLNNWTPGSGATLGSTTTNPTTLTITAATTLSVTSQQIPSYNVTVTLDSNTTSVSFTNATYGTQNITTSGSATSLRSGVEYTITATTASGYKLSTWTAGSGATLGSTTANPTTLTVTAPTTLSVTSQQESTFEWQPRTATRPADADVTATFQDFSTATCNLGASGQIGWLKDSRDGTVYTIGKLADGKCWLLDNLALDLTNSTVLNGMSSSNTNASDTTLGYLKNGGGTTSDQYAITGVVNWTDSPTYASGYSYSDPLVNLTNKDTVPTDATSQAGQYKVGGYYNYCAASAGSYCYGDGTSAGTSSGDATEDICPKGWRMPAGNTTGEYSALANAIYGSTGSTSDATAYANYRTALSLPLSGNFYSGSASSQGSGGYFWSSTRRNNSNMYYLYLRTSNVYPSSSILRTNGYSMRCVLGS